MTHRFGKFVVYSRNGDIRNAISLKDTEADARGEVHELNMISTNSLIEFDYVEIAPRIVELASLDGDDPRVASLTDRERDARAPYQRAEVKEFERNHLRARDLRAMGMGGYRGSPAEQDDRAQGIKVGGRAYWNVAPGPLKANIIALHEDAEGDPWFSLSFDSDHKDVRVRRSELMSVGFVEGRADQ
jgi:hypothetical protein